MYDICNLVVSMCVISLCKIRACSSNTLMVSDWLWHFLHLLSVIVGSLITYFLWSFVLIIWSCIAMMKLSVSGNSDPRMSHLFEAYNSFLFHRCLLRRVWCSCPQYDWQCLHVFLRNRRRVHSLHHRLEYGFRVLGQYYSFSKLLKL